MNIGLPGAIFLVSLVLRLTDKIDWSWWLVTSPLWLGLVFFCFVLFPVALIKALAEEKRKNRFRKAGFFVK